MMPPRADFLAPRRNSRGTIAVTAELLGFPSPTDGAFPMPRMRLSVMVAFVAVGVGRADSIEFNRDIRPILAENCYLCHGPDKNRRKKGLRLDDRDTAMKK